MNASNQANPGQSASLEIAGRMDAISRTAARWFAIAAIVAVVLSGVGIVLKHSAVPYMDMWDGYVDFYLRVSGGDSEAWWAPHNEHRLLLSRVLFWLDMRYLDGRSWLPLCANFLAMAAGWACFAWVSRRLVFDGQMRTDSVVVSSLLAMMLFSYIQQGNIVSGFQIQFFLALLLPLIAFVCLARSVPAEGRKSEAAKSWFPASLLAGLASIGAMANGILVLPMMVVMTAISRQPVMRIAVLFVVAIFSISAYLYGFQASPGDGSLLRTALDRPLDIAIFTIVYMGSAVGRTFHSIEASGVAGFSVIVLAVAGLIQYIARREQRPLFLAMVCLIGYVAISGVITALGRLQFGFDQAMNERYTTPSIYAISAALMLFLARPSASARIGKKAFIAMSVAAVALFAMQLRALGDRAYEKHRLAVSALALVIPANESIVDDYLYPEPARLRSIADRAIKQGIGIFGAPPYADVAGIWGRTRGGLPLVGCQVQQSSWQKISDSVKTSYLVSGALEKPPTGVRRIWITDSTDRIVGVALPGRPLPKERDPWWSRESRNGFDGFALVPESGTKIWCETT